MSQQTTLLSYDDRTWTIVGAQYGEYKDMIAMQVEKRLGYREKQEFEQLEGRIEGATAQKEDLESKISSCAQTGDFEKVRELSDELGIVSASIDTMTDRWMELAERAEVAGTV